MFIASPATSGSSATRTVGRNLEVDKEPLISPRIDRNLNEITSRVSAASRCNDNKVPNVAAPARLDHAAEEAMAAEAEDVADPRAELYLEC